MTNCHGPSTGPFRLDSPDLTPFLRPRGFVNLAWFFLPSEIEENLQTKLKNSKALFCHIPGMPFAGAVIVNSEIGQPISKRHTTCPSSFKVINRYPLQGTERTTISWDAVHPSYEVRKKEGVRPSSGGRWSCVQSVPSMKEGRR